MSKLSVTFTMVNVLHAKSSHDRKFWSMMFVKQWAKSSGVKLEPGCWCTGVEYM
jgi:hypothetical protein